MGFDWAGYRLRPVNDVAPAHAADAPGGGIKICLSLDKVNAFREGPEALAQGGGRTGRATHRAGGRRGRPKAIVSDRHLHCPKGCGHRRSFLGIIRLSSRTSNAPTPPIFRS